MARQKSSAANPEKLVEDTVATSEGVAAVDTQEEAPKVLRLMSTKNVPLYKIATRQRNMEVGTIVAGHYYPYKGKTHNAEGVFYNMGKGFVFAEDCVKIQ